MGGISGLWDTRRLPARSGPALFLPGVCVGTEGPEVSVGLEKRGNWWPPFLVGSLVDPCGCVRSQETVSMVCPGTHPLDDFIKFLVLQHGRGTK